MSDELMNQANATSEDGGTADDSTAADAGQSAPLVQKDSAASETAEQKKERISQKKWQEMTEKAKKADERDAKIKATLGIKPEDDVDVVEVLANRISDLQSEALRKEFEAQIPVVKSEKYAKAWQEINEAKKHLVQKGELSYEDLWKIIRDDGEYKRQNAAVQETQKQEQEANFGSVPFFNNSMAGVGSDKLSAMDKEIARKMGWSEKTYQSAGVL